MAATGQRRYAGSTIDMDGRDVDATPPSPRTFLLCPGSSGPFDMA